MTTMLLVCYKEPERITIKELKKNLQDRGEKKLPQKHGELYDRLKSLGGINEGDPRFTCTPVLDLNQPIPKERMYYPDTYFILATTFQACLHEWVLCHVHAFGLT
jgi:hypothetical protein